MRLPLIVTSQQHAPLLGWISQQHSPLADAEFLVVGNMRAIVALGAAPTRPICANCDNFGLDARGATESRDIYEILTER